MLQKCDNGLPREHINKCTNVSFACVAAMWTSAAVYGLIKFVDNDTELNIFMCICHLIDLSHLFLFEAYADFEKYFHTSNLQTVPWQQAIASFVFSPGNSFPLLCEHLQDGVGFCRIRKWAAGPSPIFSCELGDTINLWNIEFLPAPLSFVGDINHFPTLLRSQKLARVAQTNPNLNLK